MHELTAPEGWMAAHQARWMKLPQREDLDSIEFASHSCVCMRLTPLNDSEWPGVMMPALSRTSNLPRPLNPQHLKTCFMAWLWILGLDSHVFQTSASVFTTGSAPVTGLMCKPSVQSHHTQLLPVPWMLKEVESGRKEVYCRTCCGLTLAAKAGNGGSDCKPSCC